MKKAFPVFLLSITTIFTLSARQKHSVYAIGFYNQENLFDTCHDEGKNDYDFLPDGSYQWNGTKYTHKLRNMARTLSDMATDELPGVGCALIGLSEVENARVLDALTRQPELAERNYRYIHIEGPDKRGIDCAVLYNPTLFSVRDVKLLPYVQDLEPDTAFQTRGFLTVSGTLADEPLTIIVCHWPSRFKPSIYREIAGQQVRAIKDSILRETPQCKVLVMGDMNDDPTDKSIIECLSAKGQPGEVHETDMYNPWYNILTQEQTGTLMYRGAWNLFDQIILSPNLLKKKKSALHYWMSRIERRDYLLQTTGAYKGAPKRTTSKGAWLDGYSDHLPVVVYLEK